MEQIIWRVEDGIEALTALMHMLIFVSTLWICGYRITAQRQRFYSGFGWYGTWMLKVSREGQHVATYDYIMLKYLPAKIIIKDIVQQQEQGGQE